MSEYFLGSLGGLFNVFISIYHEWHVLERLTEWLYMERMGGRIQREGHQLGSFAKPPVDRILLTTTRHCPPIHLPSTLPTNFTQLKYTGMGCHFLLQGIFPTPGLNQCLLCLLHSKWILYSLGHQGSPSTLHKSPTSGEADTTAFLSQRNPILQAIAWCTNESEFSNPLGPGAGSWAELWSDCKWWNAKCYFLDISRKSAVWMLLW